MNRTSRYPTFLIRCIFLLSLFVSTFKLENGLLGPLYFPSQKAPATVELVLDKAPDYPVFVFTDNNCSEEMSLTPDCSREYRNTLSGYSQKVRILLKVSRQPLFSAIPKPRHRPLPCESSDEDPVEIS
jgi:hypothetical protein